MPLDDLLSQVGETDSEKLKVIPEWNVRALIEAEVAAVIKAVRHERVEERVAPPQRPPALDLGHKGGPAGAGRYSSRARVGFLPSLLEPRRRIDRALWAVIQEAHVHHWVSTRKVDDLVAAVGACQVSKSEVREIC
jgi:putative transposase